MAKPNELTVERLREVLDYNCDTGIFRWRVKLNPKGNKGMVGAVAGYLKPIGYISKTIDGYQHLAHRLAWLHFYGAWPQGQIDHWNGVRHDNWICNLRIADYQQNGANRKVNERNFLGLKGVYCVRGKYGARIRVDGKLIYLGVYNTPGEAHAAYCEAAKRYFGEFASAGHRG